MTELVNVTTLITILGVLVGLTNILTEVLKKILWDKIPSSLLAFVVSEVITMIAFFAYCAIKVIATPWYYIAAAIVLGFMVAYAAMFGFDKLKEIIQSWGTKSSGGGE